MIVVFDVDGTLLNIDHRLHHIQNKPKNWKKFYENLHLDKPIWPIVNLAYMFDLNVDNTVIICTGRSEKYKEQTASKLADLEVWYDNIYMRSNTDFRADYITKAELADQIIEKYGKIDLWVDDKAEVCEAIRLKGIQVLQVLKKENVS